MKPFEFGLGIFFSFFPLPLPFVPSGRQGEEIESRCWWELLSPSPKPLWPEGRWNQWPLCVHQAQRSFTKPGALLCEH